MQTLQIYVEKFYFKYRKKNTACIDTSALARARNKAKLHSNSNIHNEQEQKKKKTNFVHNERTLSHAFDFGMNNKKANSTSEEIKK